MAAQPPSFLLLSHPGRSGGVREDELLDEEVGDPLRPFDGGRAVETVEDLLDRIASEGLAGVAWNARHQGFRHQEGGLTLEHGLEGEERVRRVPESPHSLVEAQALVLEGVGQLVSEEDLLHQLPGRAGGVPGPFGNDVEPLLGRVVEADHLARVEAGETEQEIGGALDEADRLEGGGVRLEGNREVLGELPAEHLLQLLLGKERGGNRCAEGQAPDLFDELLRLRDPAGEEGRFVRARRPRGEDSEESEAGGPPWTPPPALAYHRGDFVAEPGRTHEGAA